LDEKTRSLLEGKGDKLFMELTVGTTHAILDTLLVERKIQNSLVRAGIINPMFLGPLAKKRKEIELEEKKEESRQVEEIKMLDDIPNDPLASPENCTLDKIVSILQNHASDPHVDSNLVGFDTLIANHVIKVKLNKYHKESMVPPKLGDVWEPRIYVTIEKITWHAVLNLGSSVFAIPKSLCDHLDLPPIEKCDIDLNLLVSLSLMVMVDSIIFLLNYI
jgi:hypothetical protein